MALTFVTTGRVFIAWRFGLVRFFLLLIIFIIAKQIAPMCMRAIWEIESSTLIESGQTPSDVVDCGFYHYLRCRHQQ